MKIFTVTSPCSPPTTTLSSIHYYYYYYYYFPVGIYITLITFIIFPFFYTPKIAYTAAIIDHFP